MRGQPGELDSYRGEGGTVYPFYTANEQSFDDDDTPPPTPMWSNLPPPAPPETASRWKAVRKQISVAGRFWSAGQDRAEEAAVSALSELLQGLVAQGALSLERRLVEHRDTPPGAVWPHGWPPRYTQRRHLATVFSASNYAGKTLNKGAYALLGATGSRLSDPALRLRFVSFDAEELPRLRVSQRRHQLVASAVLAQRDELLAAYQAADCHP
ncbi:hypothetical protein EMIHUDRAFT_203120 [Emiliania huxleyi CCMP1516]|uniref:Uncharacterized protein n=2 Tax=Emiliania huxleyi TaxID=2903 RepID=A0A0D3K5K7_EMIH1|nr:hypothetical protein EMIHUDRAFT_203120 [Emiliania huxleyi CCMP1516]EOD31042.1 hypothetical protein EMIHUDRAFT_203120 [Emiliania huxleyi CCMP1516]|eukprot:XP_005783471.1 hypothetical protein EMIHUDRAFT_203120 [Emiliania huxleyi CCMP1516]